jgi:hypothetical protein
MRPAWGVVWGVELRLQFQYQQYQRYQQYQQY